MKSVSRRGFGLASLAFLAACQKRSEAAPSGPVPPARASDATVGGTRLLDWTFDGAISTRTAILVPTWGGVDSRYPVLVALHGRGEARKPPAEGALGWPRDYALGHAIERVANPPLYPADFEGFIDAIRLSRANRVLVDHPFGGLVVVCPYLPDLELSDAAAVAAFGRFVVDDLLPRVRRELPMVVAEPAATGIDGVSLGGAVALSVGLDNPTSFGAVGCLQPALDVHDTAKWVLRAEAARRANPKLALRLLTSDGDYFKEAVRATSLALHQAGVMHDYEEVIGPHDYPFNRGPGAIEMLLWQDRALRLHG